MIGDVCDDTNASFGMAIAVSSYSIGLILGPVIGGMFNEIFGLVKGFISF